MDRAGGREDRVRVDYQYIKDDKKDLSLYLYVNLIHGVSAGSSLQRNIAVGHAVSNSYWFGYQSQCWGARLRVKTENEDTSVTVVFRLLGLG